MWFKRLTGFDESRENIENNIEFSQSTMTFKPSGRECQQGWLQIPTLESLRDVDLDLNQKISLSEYVGDVNTIHLVNNGATIQAASQFNLLEMVSPSFTPENGIDIYENDGTQGPACAMACGAGTIYRNYLVELHYTKFNPLDQEWHKHAQIGQTSELQVDCLSEIGEFFGNEDSRLWEMKNGYALLNQDGLLEINKRLAEMSDEEYDLLKGKLKVGIQFFTEVTLQDSGNIVTQVYCSALPVAYTNIESHYWERFARLILEATYEATLYAGLINHEDGGSNKVFLTLVGGGVFGNHIDWITESIDKAVEKFKNTPLDVYIVSYGGHNKNLDSIIEKRQ